MTVEEKRLLQNFLNGHHWYVMLDAEQGRLSVKIIAIFDNNGSSKEMISEQGKLKIRAMESLLLFYLFKMCQFENCNKNHFKTIMLISCYLLLLAKPV